MSHPIVYTKYYIVQLLVHWFNAYIRDKLPHRPNLSTRLWLLSSSPPSPVLTTRTQPKPQKPTQQQQASLGANQHVPRSPEDVVDYVAYSMTTMRDMTAIGLWRDVPETTEKVLVPSPFEPFFVTGPGAKFPSLVLALFTCSTHCLPHKGAHCKLPIRSAFSSKPAARKPTKRENMYWSWVAKVTSVSPDLIDSVSEDSTRGWKKFGDEVR